MPDAPGRIVKRIVVVGGGVTGLAAAHRIVELGRLVVAPIELQLLEARELGGSIVTRRRDGFLTEAGPDSFITQKPWGLAVCRRIGLDRELIPTNPASRRVFIVRHGTLHPVPEGFLLLAPTRIWPFVTSRLFSWPGKLRMAMDLLIPRRDHGPEGDESLASFVTRRLGREALQWAAQPLISGIYTADPTNLSLRATMPRFLEMESQYGSLIRAMRKGMKASAEGQSSDSGARYSLFVSLRTGMSALPRALASRLPAGTVRTRTRVTRVRREGSGWRIELDGQAGVPADAVLLACPAHASAEIVRQLDPALADELAGVRYSDSATMSLAFRRDQVGHPLDGFGFVVPVLERRSLIAASFCNVKFEGRAPEGWVLIRAFLGGAMHRDVYAMDDDHLREAVLRDLRDLIGVQGQPVFVELHRWPASMPQYPVGHPDRVRRIEARLVDWPGLAVAGNAFGGIGIPDCVHSAETAAENLLRHLTGHPIGNHIPETPAG